MGIRFPLFFRCIPLPKENLLCVVARGLAYIVKVDKPDVYDELSPVPIMDAYVVSDPGIVIFSTFTDIAAYQDTMLIWRTEGLAIDGIEILEIKNGQIYGRANNINEDVPFKIDLLTGVLILGK